MFVCHLFCMYSPPIAGVIRRQKLRFHLKDPSTGIISFVFFFCFFLQGWWCDGGNSWSELFGIPHPTHNWLKKDRNSVLNIFDELVVRKI